MKKVAKTVNRVAKKKNSWGEGGKRHIVNNKRGVGASNKNEAHKGSDEQDGLPTTPPPPPTILTLIHSVTTSHTHLFRCPVQDVEAEGVKLFPQ